MAYVFVKSCVQRLVKSHADPDMLWLLSMRLERLEKLFDSLGMAPAPPAEFSERCQAQCWMSFTRSLIRTRFVIPLETVRYAGVITYCAY